MEDVVFEEDSSGKVTGQEQNVGTLGMIDEIDLRERVEAYDERRTYCTRGLSKQFGPGSA